MQCPRCQHENPNTAKFCQECGQALRVVAPTAGDGKTPEPRTYTPRHLAEKILVTRSALEGERKQVTVLFADIKGSMELAEQVDPEEFHRIMDRFFAILSEGVHRFEGTVNQYTGDGIMALFGAPIAHEDHAQRACFAALVLRDQLRAYADELRVSAGLSFSVRMGLNSGEVVVGKIGDDLRMDYTAQGQTVGLAARMEQIAAPDRVYLSEHTAALVEGFFTLRDLGASTIKGVTRPLHVFELLDVGHLRTRLDVSRARGFARFVGRADEEGILEAARTRARDGAGAVVGVVGEAGVGKSRLCFEFVQRARGAGVAVFEAHCPAHGKAVPFLPILELLRGVFGVSERDSAHEARRKIAGELVLLDREFEEALPIVFDFLGVADRERPVPPMSPEGRQTRLFQFVRHLIPAVSARAHTVLLVDDVHWIDPASDAVLAEMVAAIAGTRTLLLLNFRPEYQAAWMSSASYKQIHLVPLGKNVARELIDALLGTDPSVAALGEAVCARTAGNPFFIEEVIQSLADNGALAGSRSAYRLARPVEQIEIPGTVQAVLAARIDRLPEEEKRVLQTAAVIGKRFPEAVLAQVAQLSIPALRGALSDLEELELIHAEASYPDAEYAFKHPLTQEVAYRSQLADGRRRVHAAVAETLIHLDAARLDERAALVAHHWDAAGEALAAARWYVRASEWSERRDPLETLRLCRKAREVLIPISDSPERLQLRMAACLGIVGNGWRTGVAEDEAAIIFAEGKELAAQAESPVFLALIYAGYGQLLGTVGRIEDNLTLCREAQEFAKNVPDLGIQLILAMAHTAAEHIAGHFRAALARADDALAAAGDDVDAGGSIVGLSPSAFLFQLRGWTRCVIGHLNEGLHDLLRAYRLAHERDHTEILIISHCSVTDLADVFNDHETMVRHAGRAVELAERIGSPSSLLDAYRAAGLAHAATDPSTARGMFQRALDIARNRRLALNGEPTLLAGLAEAHLHCGESERARALAEEACAVSRRLGIGWQEARALRARARILLHTAGVGAAGEIDAALTRAEALYEEEGVALWRPFVLGDRAAMARLLGDEQAHAQRLREAQSLREALGGRLQLSSFAELSERA